MTSSCLLLKCMSFHLSSSEANTPALHIYTLYHAFMLLVFFLVCLLFFFIDFLCFSECIGPCTLPFHVWITLSFFCGNASMFIVSHYFLGDCTALLKRWRMSVGNCWGKYLAVTVREKKIKTKGFKYLWFSKGTVAFSDFCFCFVLRQSRSCDAPSKSY